MRTFVVLKGWLAAVLLFATVALTRGMVVIGPELATAPGVIAGELLVSELNCVACHKGANAAPFPSRKSPVLGKDGMQITPKYLRSFLNDPSGYKPGTTMPDMLHLLNGTERAEAVDALVHFLISQQNLSSAAGTGAEDFQLRQGRTLYHTVGCVACHEPQAGPDTVPGISPIDPKLEQFDPSLKGTASVPLGDLARKTTVEQLAKFLIDPLKVRPSGRMPSLNLTPGEATSIAVYLLRAQAASSSVSESLIAGLKYQYYEDNFPSSPDFDSMTPKASGNVGAFDLSSRKRDQQFGFRFSGSIEISAAGTYTFFTRSDDGSMVYIDGKRVVDNNGDHPPQEKRGNIELTAGSHGIVVTYYNNGAGYELAVEWRGPGFRKQPIPASVLSHRGKPMLPLGQEEFTVDREKVNKGRQLFGSLGCAACHSGIDGVANSGTAKSLKDLRATDSGCLAATPGTGMPKYDLSSAQRTAIRQALDNRDALNRRGSEKEFADGTMARLNCYACHTRDGRGGPTDARLAYFRVAGQLDMGDEGRIPPHLTAVGAKLRTDWMREVLENKGRVRPYMATRMPQFGSENVGLLPEAFEKGDARQQVRTEPETNQRDGKFGRKLAGTGGLACISCHTVAGHKSLGIPAIDLTTMSRRLRYDWFYRYLIDPASLRPGTRMPSFWPNGEAVNRDILGGKAEAQINAIWAYLSTKPETDLPDGLIQGRMELVAESEPIIYRNFIQGAGPRAIAVGYPEKVNLAFDANQMRLAMIWQGPFIDAARHRSGRGEGYEPPLGNNILAMPAGPELAQLESSEAPWPITGGKDSGFKMGGYSLNEKRQPTFFYTFNGLRIEEELMPMPGEVDAYFKRSIRVEGTPVPRLYFRAATGEIERKGNFFVMNGKTILKFPGSEPILRGDKDHTELLVPVRFDGDAAKIIEEIIW